MSARVAHSQNEEDVIVVARRNARNGALLRDTTATRHTARLTRDTHQREPPLVYSSRLRYPYSAAGNAGESLVFSPPAGLLDPPPFRRTQRAILAGERGESAGGPRQDATAAGVDRSHFATAGAESLRGGIGCSHESSGENLRISEFSRKLSRLFS